jgi:hypothetical protein
MRFMKSSFINGFESPIFSDVGPYSRHRNYQIDGNSFPHVSIAASEITDQAIFDLRQKVCYYVNSIFAGVEVTAAIKCRAPGQPKPF